MNSCYEMEFVGEMKIEDLNPGYKVSFILNHSENPLIIASDLQDEEFLEFIKKELKTRKLHRTKYYNTRKIYEQ